MAKLPKGKIYQTDYTDLSTRVDSQTIIDSPLWVLDNSAPSSISNYVNAYSQTFYWEGSTAGYVVNPRMYYSNPFTTVGRPNFSRPEEILTIYQAVFGTRKQNGVWHFDLYIRDSPNSGDYIHIMFALKSVQTVFDTSTWDAFNAVEFDVTDVGSPVNMGVEVFDSALHPAAWENNWVVNSDGTDIRYFANEVVSSGASPMTTGTFEFKPSPPAANEAPVLLQVLASPVGISGFNAVGQPGSQDAPTNFSVALPPQEALVFNDPIFAPQEDSKVLNLDTLASPMLGEFPLHFKTRKLILFNDILDQIASMLGADQWEDLPLIDQERVKIVVNQAYRECYAPIDGRRPRWATEKMTIKFLEGQEYAPLSMDVIDIEKLPELVGHGPLSPMNAGTDQVSIRSHFSGDFRPLPGYKGNYRSMDIDDPEVDQPVWYFIDQSNSGDGYIVVPRLFVYPIPDKEYEVKLVANMLPEGMDLGDSPRLPAEVVWDILLPIAQYKLLTDPRYNGDNRELIMMQAKEAKRKLRSFASPQKHKTVRIRTRRGW